MKVMIVGDLHGKFGELNQLINQHPHIEAIIQCGDFGYFPKWEGTFTYNSYGKKSIYNMQIKNGKIPVYWCDGNHDDHESLAKLESNEILPNVFYMKRGSILRLAGYNILFIGGALSIDRDSRVLGESYWLEETISQRNIIELPDEKVDIVISHTKPDEFTMSRNINVQGPLFEDPSTKALSYVLNRYRPKFWFFGHWHRYINGQYETCKWTGLSDAGYSERWWVIVDM